MKRFLKAFSAFFVLALPVFGSVEPRSAAMPASISGETPEVARASKVSTLFFRGLAIFQKITPVNPAVHGKLQDNTQVNKVLQPYYDLAGTLKSAADGFIQIKFSSKQKGQKSPLRPAKVTQAGHVASKPSAGTKPPEPAQKTSNNTLNKRLSITTTGFSRAGPPISKVSKVNKLKRIILKYSSKSMHGSGVLIPPNEASVTDQESRLFRFYEASELLRPGSSSLPGNTGGLSVKQNADSLKSLFCLDSFSDSRFRQLKEQGRVVAHPVFIIDSSVNSSIDTLLLPATPTIDHTRVAHVGRPGLLNIQEVDSSVNSVCLVIIKRAERHQKKSRVGGADRPRLFLSKLVEYSVNRAFESEAS